MFADGTFDAQMTISSADGVGAGVGVGVGVGVAVGVGVGIGVGVGVGVGFGLEFVCAAFKALISQPSAFPSVPAAR